MPAGSTSPRAAASRMAGASHCCRWSRCCAAYFGIGEDDDGRLAREKIAGRLLLLDEAFRETLPVLFGFLGVEDPDHPAPQMGPEARERALFGAISRLVHARSDKGGGVVLVEDLHWLDPGSEAFLAHLIESLPGTRTLAIVNFRPEYGADWMRRSFYERLPLLPLSGEAIGAMVRDLIGDDSSLDGIVELIADRTGGNPFFIEEVVLSLVDRGALVGRRGAYRLAASIDRLEIPPTVQAVLAARIDRLDARDKAVLEAAAVIGREFSEPVLQRVTGLESRRLLESLGRLCAAELVFERAVYPVPQYVFKHPLTEEVAYRSQLSERRARHHAAAAAALAETDPDRLEEIARARVQPLGAGARAGAGRAMGGAGRRLGGPEPPGRRAAPLAPRAHVARGRARRPEAAGLALGASLWILQFGWRQGLSDDEVETVWREGLALAERSGNTWAECALSRLARALARDGGRGLGGARAWPRSAASRPRVARPRARDERRRHGLLDGPARRDEGVDRADDRADRADGGGLRPRPPRGRVQHAHLVDASSSGCCSRRTAASKRRAPRCDRALRLAREHDDIESLVLEPHPVRDAGLLQRRGPRRPRARARGHRDRRAHRQRLLARDHLLRDGLRAPRPQRSGPRRSRSRRRRCGS